MWKMLSTTRPAACYLDLSLLFINEGHIYSKVLPVVGSYGPVCIYNDEENIIMEDLADQGYVKYPRGEFLDSGHIILALKVLRFPSIFSDYTTYATYLIAIFLSRAHEK